MHGYFIVSLAMSHALERLLARLNAAPRPASDITGDFSHSAVSHALERGLIATSHSEKGAVFRITESGQSAMR
jgi:hypothetical protein